MSHPAPQGGFRGWVLVGVVAWVLAPLMLVGLLTWSSTNLSTSGSSQGVWVVANAAGDTAKRSVEIAVTWSDPLPIVAPAWSGLVRNVSLSVGSTVKSGDIIVQIDDVNRMAWHSSAPFYRDLSAGDVGSDVADLNSLLASLGLAEQTGDRFTSLTRLGVERLAAELGGGQNINTFSPTWIVYIPRDEVQVGKVAVTVGAVAPAAGTAIFTARPAMASGNLVNEDTSGDTSGQGDARALPGETLTVGNITVPLDGNKRTLSADGLAALSRVTDPSTKLLVGTLTRKLPAAAVDVPAAAIHTDADGVNCVRVLRDDKKEITVTVSVVSGTSGQATISGNILPGDRVGVDVLAAAYRCGS